MQKFFLLPSHYIPSKNFSATSASNHGLIEWSIALFLKNDFARSMHDLKLTHGLMQKLLKNS
jgi:hypothetical protein